MTDASDFIHSLHARSAWSCRFTHPFAESIWRSMGNTVRKRTVRCLADQSPVCLLGKSVEIPSARGGSSIPPPPAKAPKSERSYRSSAAAQPDRAAVQAERTWFFVGTSKPQAGLLRPSRKLFGAAPLSPAACAAAITIACCCASKLQDMLRGSNRRFCGRARRL